MKPQSPSEDVPSPSAVKSVKPLEAQVWLTTADQTQLLTEQQPVMFTDGAPANAGSTQQDRDQEPVTVKVDPDTSYQTMDGVGAAITGSSAYLMNQLSPERREALLNDLFTAEGINLDFIRHTIGASDFSVDESGRPARYTYNDNNGVRDDHMEQFSIRQDAAVIQVLQDIVSKKKDIKVLGTPWTAPGWMKFGEDTLTGWYLDYTDRKNYEAYARYFVKYIEAYAAKGIPIYGITLQNEPLFTTPDYPSMSMGAEEQALFISDYVGPMFHKAGLSAKIIAYDHNWEQGLEYAEKVLDDEGANPYVDGTAFHCYEGDPSAMSEVHEAFPDKSVYFTECSGGEWSEGFGDNLSWQMSNLIIGAPRNWAKNVLMWNMALNPQGGPSSGGCSDCRGVVTIDPQSGEVTRNVEYYVLGHYSRFVRPGAVRVLSTQQEGRIESVAFRNKDGSFVLIAANTGSEDTHFKVESPDGQFTYQLPSRSAVTFTWKT
ncbi:beta-1,6-glucanase [Paenibacillus lemnae]|uniref:Beta-1,6-glucanase n=2 Tax=Paenibacillus lemnae TaxID=1330551 RepID=A0A848MC15_PAELE|nr:beta-1,6-glucanase [Paenibacillus lemnae]